MDQLNIPSFIAIPPEIHSQHIRLLTDEGFELFLSQTVTDECRLDCLYSPRVDEALHEAFYRYDVPEYAPIFVNTPYAGLTQLSPWFFELDRDSPFWTELKESDSPWGFLTLGAPDKETALGHWRSLLNVLLPDNSVTHFRYYDPKVLFQLLNSCQSLETAWFMGPYAYLAISLPNVGSARWCLVSNPKLNQDDPIPIAAEYELVENTWWQVSEAQLEPFKDKLEERFKKNLSGWLWGTYPDEARIVHNQEVDMYTFINDMFPQVKEWGFVFEKQQRRCIAVLLRFLALRKPVGKESALLAKAKDDPDAVLDELERMADIYAKEKQ